MRDAAQFVPKDKLRVIHKAVLAACDANDGVTDGLIQTPGACKFDPASMACPVGQDAPECLTSGQVNAMTRFYSPIKSSDGMEVFPGFPRGAELASAWLGTLKPGGNWNGFWTDVVYENPDYDVLSRLDVAGLSDYHRAKAKVSAAYDA